MTSDAGELFDELPKMCPGCGMEDGPLEDGPSKLMLLWQYALGSYICLQCNQGYTGWAGCNYPTPEDKARSKPQAVRNIESIAAGEEPNYAPWRSGNTNAMGMGYCPPVP